MVDGTNLKLIKSFKSTIKFKVTDIGQTTKNIVSAMFAPARDGTTGITVGNKRCFRSRLSVKGQLRHRYLRIVSRISSSSGSYVVHARHYGNPGGHQPRRRFGLEFEISVTGKLDHKT